MLRRRAGAVRACASSRCLRALPAIGRAQLRRAVRVRINRCPSKSLSLIFSIFLSVGAGRLQANKKRSQRLEQSFQVSNSLTICNLSPRTVTLWANPRVPRGNHEGREGASGTLQLHDPHRAPCDANFRTDFDLHNTPTCFLNRHNPMQLTPAHRPQTILRICVTRGQPTAGSGPHTRYRRVTCSSLVFATRYNSDHCAASELRRRLSTSAQSFRQRD